MSATVHLGDCRDVLATMADASVDAIVTDPPYELGFMGRRWDGTGVAYDVAMWAQCLRVLKPGGHLVAFGGTRTYHRMACAVEDAGFEIRDCLLAWLYGQGFPKNLDVGKAIDKAAGAEREVIGERLSPDGVPYSALHGPRSGRRAGIQGEVVAVPRSSEMRTVPATDAARQWQGWGTALKPACEPIVLARKPPGSAVAACVLAHGTGALHVDGCRVGPRDRTDYGLGTATRTHGGVYGAPSASADFDASKGRWPPNVLLSHSPECEDGGGCAPGCPVAELDAQSGVLRTGAKRPGTTASRGRRAGLMGETVAGAVSPHEASKGGASRFYPTFRYQAKAPRSERPKVNGRAHCTVKPLGLMRWLVRLVTPPGGLILDPFAGSGATVEAALLEGFAVVAVDDDPDCLPWIEQRIARC